MYEKRFLHQAISQAWPSEALAALPFDFVLDFSKDSCTRVERLTWEEIRAVGNWFEANRQVTCALWGSRGYDAKGGAVNWGEASSYEGGWGMIRSWVDEAEVEGWRLRAGEGFQEDDSDEGVSKAQ